MNLPYHIHYRTAGQKGSHVDSIVCTNAAGGFASGAFVRKLWESMKNTLYRTGHMEHPDSGRALEFASLHYGGYEVNGNAMGGEMVQRWDAVNGFQFLREPEPELYSPQAKMAAANIDSPPQPEPVYDHEDRVFTDGVTVPEEEIMASKKSKRTKRETKAEV